MTTKPLLRVLAGEPVWPPPIWLMRQAGRYLPEYRAARATAPNLVAAFTTPALAEDITLQPIRRFGMDAAILYSDILILPWALGYGLEFKEGEGPVLPPLRSAADLETLDPRQLGGGMAPVLETVQRVRARLEAEHPGTALIGFAGAPFTVACYVVEGGGSKDHALVRQMAYAQPALFDALMERLTLATIEYLSGQAEAGAECLMLFDSWAGVLPPALFARYVTAPARQIGEAIRARHPGMRMIGFPRLAGSQFGPYAHGAGMDAVAMDTGIDPAWAVSVTPAGVALQGNLDPIAVVAGGDAMRAGAAAVRDALQGRPHVFNLGHGLVPQTPPEHVAALVGLVRAV
jgi:uroporphyrinogen decarboxylase